MNLWHRIALPLGAAGLLGMVLPSMRAARPPTLPFKDARLKIEFNASAGDVGIQVFADAEPWDLFMIEAPNGKKIVDVRGKANLGALGMTELFFESHEPALDDLPLDQFLALFPEGDYHFFGVTTDGERITGTAAFTHAIPAGPVIVEPAEGSIQDPADVTIDWDPVVDPPGIQIVEYEVIVEQEDPPRALSIHVPGSVTSLTIPPEFFEPAQEYKMEVLAIEVGGNQTITEGSFSTQ